MDEEKDMQEEMIEEVHEHAAEEKTARQKYADKAAEMKEKYKDAIYDIAIRQSKDVGVAFEMLKAIPRAILHNEEPLYATEVDLNIEELTNDYLELLGLSEEVANEI